METKIKVLEKYKKPVEFKDYETDITVFREKEETEIKDGVTTIRTIKEPINLTRKINETAKLLKRDTAQEKLDAITRAIQEN